MLGMFEFSPTVAAGKPLSIEDLNGMLLSV
jgi:hypothetical protein